MSTGGKSRGTHADSHSRRLGDNTWVTAGRLPGTHLTDLQRPWRRSRARAGLEDVRIHDFRHLYFLSSDPPSTSPFAFRNQMVTGFAPSYEAAGPLMSANRSTAPATRVSDAAVIAAAPGASPGRTRRITDLTVASHDDAVEKLRWYAMRWKIELFHEILKSGCRAEQARLRTAERLVRLITVFCILCWRLFWLTMFNRTDPDFEPALVLTEIEIKLLNRLIPDPDPSLLTLR